MAGRARRAARSIPAYRIRRARMRDVELLVRHRVGMWRDIGRRTARELRGHVGVYRAWLSPRLRNGRVVGLIAESPDGRPLGSGCVWFSPDHPRPGVRDADLPYVHSMFTEPRARGRGIGSSIVRGLVELARERGYQRISLHAAAAAKPLYERLGFTPTSEMRLWLDPRLAKRGFGVLSPPAAVRRAARFRRR